MNPKPVPKAQQEIDDKPPGYQPTIGRKLFMLGLCVVGLIVVWAFYLFDK